MNIEFDKGFNSLHPQFFNISDQRNVQLKFFLAYNFYVAQNVSKPIVLSLNMTKFKEMQE